MGKGEEGGAERREREEGSRMYQECFLWVQTAPKERGEERRGRERTTTARSRNVSDGTKPSQERRKGEGKRRTVPCNGKV